MTLLEGRGLTIAFGGVHAVEDVSLRAEQGELAGLIGPNGAGKTTLLRLLTGVLRPDSGRVLFEGADITRMPIHRRAQLGLALTHQIVRPFRDMTLAENVTIAARALAPWKAFGKVGVADERARALALLERLGIADASDKPARSVPLGYLKRMQVARALALEPRLLLLDEPLAALDHPLRRRVLPYLARVRAELDVPMLIVTHDPRTVQALADDLIVLRRGRVIARGAPQEVLTDPAVFPLAEEGGYETVLPARLEATDAGASTVRLGAAGDGPRLVVPRTEGAPGEQLLVGIPARETLLATAEPTGLSARNVLPGRIAAVRPLAADGGLLLVTVELAAAPAAALPPVATEVTANAAAELALTAGKPVYVILKTAGCVVYGGRGGER